MDEEETERLIDDLRDMLIRNGFGWAVFEAEDSLYPTVAPRTRALALIDVAEGVTADIAAVEISALEILGGEEIIFKPDESDQDDDVAGQMAYRADELPRGPQRRAMLEDLANRRSVFQALRRNLNGDI